MPRLEEFCVFRATIALLKERGLAHIIHATYKSCLQQLKAKDVSMQNCVRMLYEPFSVEEINQQIVKMLRPSGVTTPIELVFQSIEGLHHAIPKHQGDWYFTGYYPTQGGTKSCNQSFINYYEQEELGK